MTNGFDKLLRESLSADAAADRDTECLDAALLAGWFDGTLSSAERTTVEAHAASCSRCQAMIAALVRTDRPSPRVWWRAPAVRWLAPLAVASAGSLVVWMGVRSPEEAAAPPAAQTSARLDSVAPASPALTESPGTARALSSDGGAATADAGAKSKPPAEVAARERVSANAVPGRARDAQAPAVATEARDVPPPRVEPLPQQAGSLPSLPPLPEASRPSPSPAQGQAPPAAAAASAAGTRATQVTTAPSMDAAGQSLSRTVAGVSASGARLAAVVASPDRFVRWRIAGQGQVERSVDGGATWQTQTTGVNATLTAGAAPSATVCWFVGWRGVVLKTSDGGQTWTRVAFPEALDLMTVIADDDKVATVTAAGGRQLHTTDGGATWK